MTVIRLPRFGVDTKVEVMIAWPADAARRLALLDGVPGLLARLRRVSTLLNSQWPKEWSPDDLLSALETGNRITLHPQDAVSELGELAKSLPSLIKEIRSLDITKEVITRSINHLSAGNDRVKENRPQSGAEPDLN
jgi:hypothetical protein